MLANGRVMVYEDIGFFANKSLDKFRFRLVESPMVLNCQQASESFFKSFARERECGLQCLISDSQLKINGILVPGSPDNSSRNRPALSVVMRHGKIQLHSLGDRSRQFKAFSQF
jgi:hypothetical protein